MTRYESQLSSWKRPDRLGGVAELLGDQEAVVVSRQESVGSSGSAVLLGAGSACSLRSAPDLQRRSGWKGESTGCWTSFGNAQVA
jgi:hypothetical protein